MPTTNKLILRLVGFLFFSLTMVGPSYAATEPYLECSNLDDPNSPLCSAHFNAIKQSLDLSLEKRIPQGALPVVRLGVGYSSDRQIPTAMCIKGTVTHAGQAYGLIDIARYYDINEVKKQLHMSADVGINIKYFSFDTASDFVREIEDNDYSETFVYRTYVKLKNSVYSPQEDGEVLNEIGKEYRDKPDLFYYVCGDKYVSQIEHGGYLYVAVKFTFNSHSDKQAFKESLSFSIFQSFFHFGEAFSNALATSNKNGWMKISGFQLGGDPTKLGKIISGQDSQALPIASCSFDNLEKCKQALNNVITYATSTTGDNFLNQIKNDDPSSHINAATTDFVLEDYLHLGITYPYLSKITPDIDAARKQLVLKLQDINKNRQQVKFLMDRYAYDPSYVTDLELFLSNLYQQENAIMNAGKTCFVGLDHCVASSNLALAGLNQLDSSLLDDTPGAIIKLGTSKEAVDAGDKLYQGGDYKEAARHYAFSLKKSDASISLFYSRVYLVLGDSYQMLGKYDKAITNYSEALNHNDPWIKDNRSQIYNARGDAYYKAGKHSSAIQDYAEALKQNDQWLKNRSNEVLYKLGRSCVFGGSDVDAHFYNSNGCVNAVKYYTDRADVGEDEV